MASSSANIGSSGNTTSTSTHGGKTGVPSFAAPWIELGKLEEREKWQALAINLVETSITSEFLDLKRGVVDTLPPRLPELKSKISEKVEDAQLKVSKLISEYRKLLFVETPYTEKQAMIHALQYQACGFEESIPDMIEEFTATVTEEMMMEEPAKGKRT